MARYGYDHRFRGGARPEAVERGMRDFGRGSYGGRMHARGAYDLDLGPREAPRYDFDVRRGGPVFRRGAPERSSWARGPGDLRAHGGATGRERGMGSNRLRGVYGSDYHPGDPLRGHVAPRGYGADRGVAMNPGRRGGWY